MARKRKQSNRAGLKRTEIAQQLIGLGGILICLPMILGATPFGQALGAVLPLGIFFVVVGGGLFWMARKVQKMPRATFGEAALAPLNPRNVAKVPAKAEGDTRTEVVGHRGDGAPRRHDKSNRDAALEVLGPPKVRPAAWSARIFAMIEWRRFEALVEGLFQQAGFITKSQSHGADEGIDVWLFAKNQPEVPVALVQCKHWRGSVGVDKIRELLGVMAAKKVSRGLFATTSTFSEDARDFARGNGIDLLDIDRLLELIGQRRADQQQALLNIALEGEYWRPTCVNCGVKMVERVARGGDKRFWGCAKFPRCKNTMPMRSA